PPPPPPPFPSTTLFRSCGRRFLSPDRRDRYPGSHHFPSGGSDVATRRLADGRGERLEHRRHEDHAAVALLHRSVHGRPGHGFRLDRKSTRLNSSHVKIS